MLKKKELVIIDKADSLIFKDTKKFSAFIKKASTVCFKATPPKNQHSMLECEIFDKLGFKTFSYFPSQLERPSTS